eukprot:8052574-Pyramimonas_sp.AAC.1
MEPSPHPRPKCPPRERRPSSPSAGASWQCLALRWKGPRAARSAARASRGHWISSGSQAGPPDRTPTPQQTRAGGRAGTARAPCGHSRSLYPQRMRRACPMPVGRRAHPPPEGRAGGFGRMERARVHRTPQGP